MSLGNVMIVPGIGGNDLSAPASFLGFGPGFRVWLNPAVLVAGGWRLLKLSLDGITPAIPLTGPLVAGQPLAAYYGTLASELARRGWAVFGAVLDWRGSIANDATRLAGQIISLSANGPIHLLCHSRGGLVARRAFTLLDMMGQLSLVGRCVGMGVPHQGSFDGVGLVAGWNPTAAMVGRLLEGIAAATVPFGVLGTVRDVITSWPSAYELFPQPFASGLPTAQWEVLYNAAAWDSAGMPVSTSRLAAAMSAWSSLAEVPTEVQWVDAVGVGFLSGEQLVQPLPPRRSSDVRWTANGDGVVPEQWATQPRRLKIRTPTSHQALPYDGRLIDVLADYLEHGLSGDVSIGGPPLA